MSRACSEKILPDKTFCVFNILYSHLAQLDSSIALSHFFDILRAKFEIFDYRPQNNASGRLRLKAVSNIHAFRVYLMAYIHILHLPHSRRDKNGQG